MTNLNSYSNNDVIFGGFQQSRSYPSHRLSLSDENEDEYEEDDDYYSPTDWEREPDESDEDYRERMEDLNDLLEYND